MLIFTFVITGVYLEEYLQLFLLFLLGIIAGIINVVAGGGSLLTVPALIFMGLEGAMANGTNRLSILIQSLSAVSSFKKENVSDFKMSLRLSLFTLPGAVAGVIAAVKISSEAFQQTLAVIMILVLISMLIPKAKNNTGNKAIKKFPRLIYPVMFFIGFYGGFIQAGVGFLLMAALHYIMKMDLLTVNMHKAFIVLVFTIPAMLVFIISGNVNWIYGLTLSAGNGLGAWWSAKHSVRKGEKFIKIFMFAAVIIMAVKLLNIF